MNYIYLYMQKKNLCYSFCIRHPFFGDTLRLLYVRYQCAEFGKNANITSSKR